MSFDFKILELRIISNISYYTYIKLSYYVDKTLYTVDVINNKKVAN